MSISRGRIFLVGCPRSGTTLLQSLLAAHPQIASFPESHFFRHLFIQKKGWRLTLGRLGFASLNVRSELKKFLHDMEQDKMGQYIPKLALLKYQYVQAFIKALDILTEQQGKTFWLEKTPSHLHYIEYIEKAVSEAKFIHILREGADVVASLYEVTHKHPEIWGKPRDIDQCIQRWIRDIQISYRYGHKPNHILVRYENLVENPDSVLRQLCEFIGAEFDVTMLQRYSSVTRQITLKNEAWKSDVRGEIRNANAKQFYELFDDKQQQYILNRLSEINLNDLSKKASGVKIEVT